MAKTCKPLDNQIVVVKLSKCTVKKNKAFLLSQSDLNNPFDKNFNFMIKSLSKCESNINCNKIHKSYKIQILIEN